MPQQPPIEYDAEGNAIIPAMGDQPSALIRFGSSAWKQINPVSAVEGLYNIVRHPIDTASAIGGNLVNEWGQIPAQLSAGNYGQAVESAVKGVPLVGPPVGEAIDQFQAGDIAGGAGTLAGLAVPYTRPFRMAKGAAVATARTVAPSWAARQALRLENLAESKVATVAAPQIGANKVRIGNDAAKVAPGLLKRGLSDVWSREGLHDNVKAGLEVAGKKLDDAAAARPSWRGYETSDVIAALERKKSEVQAEAIQASKWPRRIDDDGQPIREPYGESQTAAPERARVAAIDKAINEVKALGPTAKYDALRDLRAGWDLEAKPVYSGAVTPEYIANRSRQMGAADVTGAIREFLASKDSGTAAANAEWSFFKKAKSVLDATEEVERTRPNRGGKIMSRVAGSIVGSQMAGALGGIAGYMIAPAAEVSVGMGVTTKLKMATQLNNLASAIRTGNASKTAFYANQFRRTAAQVGVLAQNQRDGNQPAYPPLVASHETTQPPTTPVYPLEMDTLPVGKRAQFEDGSVWEKGTDGTVRRIQ